MTRAILNFARDAAWWYGFEAVNPAVSKIRSAMLGTRLRLRRLWLMLGAVTLPVLALDQWSKWYITTHLALNEMIPLIPNLLDITYTRNPGAAFSLFADLQPGFRDVFFFTLSAIAIVVLVLLLAFGSRSATTSMAFALILGGTIGNLVDRVAWGNVVDFIYVHRYAFHYPVFNLADSAITIGVALVLIFPWASPGRQRGSFPSESSGPVVRPIRRAGSRVPTRGPTTRP